MHYVKLPSGRMINLEQVVMIKPGTVEKGFGQESPTMLIYSNTGDYQTLMNEDDVAALSEYMDDMAIKLVPYAQKRSDRSE